MSKEDFIITAYCIIDDLMKKQSENQKNQKNQKIRKSGFQPALSDS